MTVLTDIGQLATCPPDVCRPEVPQDGSKIRIANATIQVGIAELGGENIADEECDILVIDHAIWVRVRLGRGNRWRTAISSQAVSIINVRGCDLAVQA